MCWSNRRIYDLPYIDCLREIDAATARLKSRGATEFFVAGCLSESCPKTETYPISASSNWQP